MRPTKTDCFVMEEEVQWKHIAKCFPSPLLPWALELQVNTGHILFLLLGQLVEAIHRRRFGSLDCGVRNAHKNQFRSEVVNRDLQLLPVDLGEQCHQG